MNGLVLCLDAANPKSYGDNTENLTLQTSQIGVTPNYSVGGIVGLNTTATTAPNGLYEASLLDNNGNVGANYVYGNAAVGLTTNTTYTYSIHIKQGTKPDFQITIDENGFGGKRYYSIFTYSTETVTTGITGNTGNDGVVVGSSVSKLTNGWYRLSLTFRTSTTAVSGFVDMINRFGNTSGSNYVWGRQLEYGSTANTYYPTTITAKTRGTIWTDISGRGNTGTLTNGPTYSSANFGSIVFDGTNDYVIATRPSSIVAGGQITISLWAKWITTGTTISTIQMLLDNNHSGAPQGFVLQDRPDLGKSLTFSVRPNQNGAVSTFIVGDGSWHHITGTNDGSTSKLYIDGVFNSQATESGGIISVYPDITIGLWQGGGRYLNGNVSQVQIYNRALTAAEVSQNFNATRGRFGI
jgi:hypothetical protein